MAIEVATWNVQERLAIPNYSNHIVEETKRLDADVVMLTDAFWMGNELHDTDAETLETAMDAFTREGYGQFRVNYGDRTGHFPGRYLLALNRLPGIKFSETSAGMYNAVVATVEDPDRGLELTIAGAHFDDLSEENRIEQAEDIVDGFDLETSPVVIMGDLNAMHASNSFAKRLRFPGIPTLSKLVPGNKPRNDYEREHGRPRAITRLVEMADGRTLKTLVDAGLRDADSQQRPTMPVKNPRAQLDHIMVNQFVDVINFQTHDTFASDHRAISATLLVKDKPLERFHAAER